MQTTQDNRPLRTIVDRYGWPKVLLVACIIGASGGWISSHINHNDGPPSCAKNFIGVQADDGETRNKMVDCDTTVETWCDKHHPADGADCYVRVEETGEYTIGRD